MDSQTWIAFAMASLLISLSPGSGAILSISHGSVYGVRATSATIWGLQVGLLGVLLVAGLGVGSLLVASETAFLLLKVLGALYLIYLGVKQWRSRHGMLEGHAVEDALKEARGGWGQRFMAGMLTNLTNPKGIVFMVAVLPQFLHPGRPVAIQLLIMAATMVLTDIVVMHGYAFSGKALRRLLVTPRAARWQNRTFGAVFMLLGVSLFFVQRRGAA